MRRLTIVLLAAIATVLVGAAGALAAVTIGPAEPNPSPSTAQSPYSPSGRLMFNKTAPAGTVLTTPSEGTITSWRFYTNDVGSGATAQLYALTSAGGESFTVVAIGPKEPLTPAAPQESSPNSRTCSRSSRATSRSRPGRCSASGWNTRERARSTRSSTAAALGAPVAWAGTVRNRRECRRSAVPRPPSRTRRGRWR